MADETILIADEDPRTTKLLEVSLTNAGYRVFVTGSVERAVELYRDKGPDLVISSVSSLQGGDGFELCETLEEQSTGPMTPFLFLSHRDSVEERKTAIELGASEYIPKPVYIKEVVERVDFLLRDRTKDLLKTDNVREFKGTLDNFRLIDLFQSIQQKARSGHLEVVGQRKRGEVYFRNGTILDAECGSLRGEEAIFRLACWEKGEFFLEFGDEAHPRKIERDTEQLIMETIERLDVWNQLTEALPAVDRVFVFKADDLSMLRQRTSDAAARTARLFDGVRTIRDVINDSSFDDLSTLQIIRRLFENNWLEEAEQVQTRSSDHWNTVSTGETTASGAGGSSADEFSQLQRKEKARRAAEAEQLKGEQTGRDGRSQALPSSDVRGVPFGPSGVPEDDGTEVIPPSRDRSDGNPGSMTPARPEARQKETDSPNVESRSEDSTESRQLEDAAPDEPAAAAFAREPDPGQPDSTSSETPDDAAQTPDRSEGFEQPEEESSETGKNEATTSAENEGAGPKEVTSVDSIVEQEELDDEGVELAFDEYSSPVSDWRYWTAGVAALILVGGGWFVGDMLVGSTASEGAKTAAASADDESKKSTEGKQQTAPDVSPAELKERLRSESETYASSAEKTGQRLALVLSGVEPNASKDDTDDGGSKVDESAREGPDQTPSESPSAESDGPEESASDETTEQPAPAEPAGPSEPSASEPSVDVAEAVGEIKGLIERGSIASAESKLDQLRRNAPDNSAVARLYLDLASVYFRKDNRSKEKQAYQSFLQMKPDGERAKEVRSILESRF